MIVCFKDIVTSQVQVEELMERAPRPLLATWQYKRHVDLSTLPPVSKSFSPSPLLRARDKIIIHPHSGDNVYACLLGPCRFWARNDRRTTMTSRPFRGGHRLFVWCVLCIVSSRAFSRFTIMTLPARLRDTGVRGIFSAMDAFPGLYLRRSSSGHPNRV